MPKFSLADPYRALRFRISVGSGYVAGLARCSDLGKLANPPVRRGSGKAIFDPITLEEGISNDRAFQEWASLVNDTRGNVMIGGYKKTVVIDVFNNAGQKEQSYSVVNCVVSQYQAVPNMDTSANGAAIQNLKLQRDI
jgi:phage tail-like protein